MKEIQEHKIKIYEFPDVDEDEDNKLVRKIKVMKDAVLFKLDSGFSDWSPQGQPKIGVSFVQGPHIAAAISLIRLIE